MKKQVKRLLSVGLCLALGLSVGGGLAACKDSGENTPTVDWNAGTWSKPEASYWIAGTLNGYENTLANNGWGEDLGEESVPAERRFEQNSENDKLWRLVINLYKDEEFKIRFGALGWASSARIPISINRLPMIRTVFMTRRAVWAAATLRLPRTDSMKFVSMRRARLR